MLTHFTSYDEIRAILGVSPEELDDSTLELPLYSQSLSIAMEDLHSGMEETLIALIPKTAKSFKEQRLLDIASVYSAYAIGKMLLTGLSMFAPRTISDGRASYVRTIDPYAQVRSGVETNLPVMREKLLSALAAVGQAVPDSAWVMPTMLAVSSLTVNPITG